MHQTWHDVDDVGRLRLRNYLSLITMTLPHHRQIVETKSEWELSTMLEPTDRHTKGQMLSFFWKGCLM